MSHPCGNYDSNTLKDSSRLGIKIGFRSNTSMQSIKSNLEIPREDHANILKNNTKMKITVFLSNQPRQYLL